MGNIKPDNPCAVCGQTKPEMFRSWFDGYVKLYRCKQCGFVAQYPGPGTSTIITDYEDAYSLDFLNKGHEFMYPERRNAFQDILNRIIKIKSGSRILDVGCGDGHFLYLCSKKGFDLYGVEDSKELSSYAAQKTGAKIVKGLYDRDMFPENHFDVITLIQVLEHIPDPMSALEIAKYHLRENGILVIEVPSIYAPHFIAYELTGIKKFVKPPTGVIYSHYGYFSPKSLTTLTERCGFKKLSVTTGRWQYKYTGQLGNVGKVIDPLLNLLRIGGILYFGAKNL
jgi:SAM-dependent methyltransferase